MKRMQITGWGVFWVFVGLYFIVDTLIFLRGFDTVFWGYKTDNEKAYQQIKLGLKKPADSE